MSKVKNRKMDPYLVSDEPWEIGYIADLFDTKQANVRAAKRKVGVSRKKIYNEIRRRHRGD